MLHVIKIPDRQS